LTVKTPLIKYRSKIANKALDVARDYILRKAGGDEDKALELVMEPLAVLFFNLTLRWRGKQFRRAIYTDILRLRDVYNNAMLLKYVAKYDHANLAWLDKLLLLV
jgi:hypothetical protein